MVFLYICVLLVSCVTFAAENNEVDSAAKTIEVSEQSYEPNWHSLDSRPLPTWYDKAKVGIFIHWGVYSVPSMGSEWFWTNWRDRKAPSYVEYMRKNFKPGFTYQEFANDFTAEHFNANTWAEMFEASGARYVVLTSKHHDGYCLWPSEYSFSWNSVDVGPHRDIIKELSQAIRGKTSLKFGLYHSLFEWFNPLYVADRNSSFIEQNFVSKKVLPEMVELVKSYQPEVLWSDGEWEAPYKYWNATEFIAWLYNESPVRKTIVTNDRWGMETLCKHGDFHTCQDRYNPGVLQPHKWENAMTLDKYSWGNRANARLEDFYTSDELIAELVTTVSCGGNILVNVGPTKTGMIDPIFEERLRDMGKWLGVNGEAIYDSSPWKHQNDTQTADVWYTANGDSIYAIVVAYPYDTGSVSLYSMAEYFTDNTTVSMLGFVSPLEWVGSKAYMDVKFPSKSQTDKLGLQHAWTLKITIPKIN